MTAAPQHAVPTARPPLTYADCWNCRGRQSFWLTLHFGYRLGALLALSWATSSYWLFVLIFHSLCFLFALSYAAKTIRHLRSSASS